MPTVQPMALLSQFHVYMSEANAYAPPDDAAPQHVLPEGQSLIEGDNRNPRPVDGPETRYNRLLFDLDARLRGRGSSNEEQGLPQPLDRADAGADELARHRAEFTAPAAVVKNAALVRERVVKMANNEQQLTFFWAMVRRLRAQHPDPAWWDGEWQRLFLPPVPPGPPPRLSPVVFLNAKGGRGKTFVLNALIAAARAMQVWYLCAARLKVCTCRE